MTLGDIVAKVALVLRDVGHVRSTQQEIEGWVYAGQVQAAERRPDLFATDVVVPLAAGSRQAAPVGTIEVLRVHGNCDAGGLVTGRTVTKTTSEMLDQAAPSWRSGTPASAARQWAESTRTGEFDVYPPNDGTGRLLCELASVPASTGELVLPAEYHMALVDYALARALSKDSKDEATSVRAAGAYNAFQGALK